MEWDVRLLSASYRRQGDDRLVIEIFGKTKEGDSITIKHVGFQPYFHLLDPGGKVGSELESDPNVVDLRRMELFHRGEVHPALKVVVKFPWLVPEFRKRYRDRFTILAADIPFHHRFIYDVDMASCIRVRGREAEGDYTTDLVVEMESPDDFQNIDPFNPDLKVMAFDIETSIRNGNIYTVCYVVKEGEEIRQGDPIQGEEGEIIRELARTIGEEDPDVLTGYNIDNYDIPTIRDRARELGIESLEWGRDGSEPKHIMGRFWRLHGRLVADAWWAAKMELRPKQETLNHVAKLVLGEEKMDVDPKRMDDEWREDRDKVMRYCVKDAELSLRILDHLGTVRKDMDLAAVSKLPVDDVLTSGNSQLIDSILIREADRASIEGAPVGVPLTGRYDRRDAIEGGYVHTIAPGLYHWVCVLDFKSMYPSLIISKNICFTTLSQDGEVESPTGVRFMSKERRNGLLPSILADLMERRDQIKRRMREAEDPEEHRYHDGLQQAIKILMNSVYGVFASSFYRFTDKSIGSSITAFARETVKDIIGRLEEEGHTVIYSDTDSLFVQSPHADLDGSIQFGREMASRFSKEGAMLEFEKVLEPLFSHGKKKRYVGKVVWPEEEMLIRGYEIRRTDSFDLQSEVLTEVFRHILNGETERAVELARQRVKEAQEGEVPVEKLVISRTVKDFSFYKDPDSQANVQAARKLIDMGYEFIPGMKVSWVVTDNTKTPQEVEPYVSGREFPGRPDHRYYAERVAQTVARATEVFGWDERSLMLGSQQSTLFDQDFGPPKKSRGEGEVKRTDRNLSLEDFM
ncbi:MAG: DNA-directed DNA polymerase [Methanomassiliicoccales archaeon]